MSSPLKLDKLLRDEDRAEFDALAALPGTTRNAAWRWLRERGYDVSENAVRSYLRRARPGAKPKQFTLRVDQLLRPEDRPRYEEMIADPGKTTKELHEHLRGRDYDVSYDAVQRHRERWRPLLLEVKSCAEFGVSLAEVAEDLPQAAMDRGALLGLDQLILQQVFRLRKEDKVSAPELSGWVDTLSRTLKFRRDVMAFARREQRRAEEGPGRPKEERPAFNGVEIANCVRRILGVPLPGEPVPELPAPPLTASPSPGTPGEGRGEGT